MAVRKMTFSLPADLAERFTRRFPGTERSRQVALALERTLIEEDEQLLSACRIANSDPEAQALEEEWDRVQDLDLEPWNGPPSR